MDAQPTLLQDYNAAVDLIERNLKQRPEKIAYIDAHGSYSFAELAVRVNRCANALVGLGLPLESRLMVTLLDTIDQSRPRPYRREYAADYQRFRFHLAR
jgi:hypothetical protein